MRTTCWIILAILWLGLPVSSSQAAAYVSRAPRVTSPWAVSGFLEMWNNAAYYETNQERLSFNSLLARYEGKVGLSWQRWPWQLYGVYYGVFSQDESYWNNSLATGWGVRYLPFRNYTGSSWRDEWLPGVKFFVENLHITYLRQAASAAAAALPDEDWRYGLEIWHEWNLDDVDPALPWAELWLNFSHRTTNFVSNEANQTILYWQNKIGRHLGGGVEVYLRADLTYASSADYWLNTAVGGVGLRIEPWRGSGEVGDLFRKFKMFAEVLGVVYLRDQPAEASKRVGRDVRFGVDFSLGR